jgi:DNA mismatch repair protein MutS
MVSFKQSNAKIYNEYFNLQDKHFKEFGRKMALAYQVGAFYQFYGENNENDIIFEIGNVADLAIGKIISTQEYEKNSNPRMAGFKKESMERKLGNLLKNGFTVVIYDQDEENKSCRKLSKVISPAVCEVENDEKETNNLMVIYIENEDVNINISLGITITDVSTGDVSLFEFFNDDQDTSNKFCKNKKSMDELYRVIETYNPKEIIIYYNPKLKSFVYNDILPYINSHKYAINVYDEIKKDVYKVTFQEEVFKRVYKKIGMLNTHEYLDLTMRELASISFTLTILFIDSHDPNLILNLRKPKFNEDKERLILTHNAISQLNLISKDKNRYSSLINLIDFTITGMGKRQLYKNMLNPITDKNKLECRYNIIENIECNDFDLFLHSISDIERIHRKMSIKSLKPTNIITLKESYINIIKLHEMIKTKYNNLFKNLNSEKRFIKLKELLDEIDTAFCLDKLSNSFDINFFKPGYNNTLNLLNTKILEQKHQLNNICSSIGSYIDDKSAIKAKKMKLSGTYKLTTSKTKYEKLMNILKNNDINQEFISKFGNLKFTKLSNSVDILSEQVDNISEIIIKYKNNLVPTLKNEFKNFVHNFYNKNEKLLHQIEYYVSFIDVMYSGKKCAQKYCYSKPEIGNSDSCSFIVAKNIRHPIIEQIHKDTEFIPNDIVIGKCNQIYLSDIDSQLYSNNINGIFLFGLNSSGKSTLMKSVALSIILAQAGFYVPCSKFIYYPFNNIVTRISSNDDIFKGYGSFEVEISEIRNMINYSTPYSLIVGDELCKGTEVPSAISIVASVSKYLANKNTNFIFTSHLHQLVDIIKNDNIKYFHFNVFNDSGIMVYNRKLINGPGSALYGIEVAKAMKLDKQIIQDSLLIRNSLSDRQLLSNIKNTHFNSNMYRLDCSICGEKAQEIHHINQQKFADKNGNITHFHKNNKHNLVPLCEKCHLNVHHGHIIIKGYTKTFDGIKLLTE